MLSHILEGLSCPPLESQCHVSNSSARDSITVLVVVFKFFQLRGVEWCPLSSSFFPLELFQLPSKNHNCQSGTEA